MRLTLTRRPGSENWYLRGSVAGKRFFRSTGTSDKAAAENIRIRSEATLLERASLGRKATATFAEAALNYMNSGGEARFLAPILHHFGAATKLTEIDNAAINTAAGKLYAGAKPATINRQLITPVAAIMRMAAEDGLCTPIILRRRKVKDKKTRWLTPEEFEPFAAALEAHQVPVIGFMIGTGARVRETLSLSASTLYMHNRQALLADTKNDHPRMVRFPERSAGMIQSRPMQEAGAVFRTGKGKAYVIRDNTGGQLKRGFDKAREAAGLGREVTPHTIRHTWATWFYAQTRDFGELLDLGGWSKADVANIYRKIAPDDLAERLLKHGWDFRRAGRTDTMQPVNMRLVRNT